MRIAAELVIAARRGRAYTAKRVPVFRILPVDDGQAGDCVRCGADTRVSPIRGKAASRWPR